MPSIFFSLFLKKEVVASLLLDYIATSDTACCGTIFFLTFLCLYLMMLQGDFMIYFAQICFSLFDGTRCSFTKTFDSHKKAQLWVGTYLDDFAEWSPIWDITEFNSSLEDL